MSGYDCIRVCLCERHRCPLFLQWQKSNRHISSTWMKSNEFYLSLKYTHVQLSLLCISMYKIRRVLIVKHLECLRVCWTNKSKRRSFFFSSLLSLFSLILFFHENRRIWKRKKQVQDNVSFLITSIHPRSTLSILSLSLSFPPARSLVLPSICRTCASCLISSSRRLRLETLC